jgi:hypothetical protein
MAGKRTWRVWIGVARTATIDIYHGNGGILKDTKKKSILISVRRNKMVAGTNCILSENKCSKSSELFILGLLILPLRMRKTVLDTFVGLVPHVSQVSICYHYITGTISDFKKI